MRYTIYEVSKITGISKRELLCYLHRGIVVPETELDEEKNISKYKYTDDDMFKIGQTVMYQQLGYSLSKIEELCKRNLVGETKELNRESM